MRKPLLEAIVISTIVGLSMFPTTSAFAAKDGGGGGIYSSLVTPLPGNLPSVGAEAYAFNEFGNEVTFAAGPRRTVKSVVVTMSSWACVNGHWYLGNCSTPAGATFSQPITLNIYNPSTDGWHPGTLITSVTQTFAIPYRPSADPRCTGPNLGKWYQVSSGECFNGLAVNITFDFPKKEATLPDTVVFGITYNTTDFGYSPVGLSACNLSDAGCPYDSLNIALSQDPTNVTVGSDPDVGKIWQNSPIAAEYCDVGAHGVNFFRLDSPDSPSCWGVDPPYTSPPYYVPAVQFKASAGGGGD